MYKALGTGSQGMLERGVRDEARLGKDRRNQYVLKTNILILPEAMFPLIGFWT